VDCFLQKCRQNETPYIVKRMNAANDHLMNINECKICTDDFKTLYCAVSVRFY
jgi:hypothetical protein